MNRVLFVPAGERRRASTILNRGETMHRLFSVAMVLVSSAAAQAGSDPERKTVVCHRTQGAPAYVLIEVSNRAVGTHLKHGDCLVDDGLACTGDRCDPRLGCVHSADDTACDDGRFCNGIETCSPRSGCQPGTPPDCNDGVGCTVDSCSEATGSCTHAPDDTACDDGRFCNGAEVCRATDGCHAGTAPNCEDGVDCTVDSCNEETNACEHSPDQAVCEDETPCTNDTCDPDVGCVHEPFCVTDADCSTDPCVIASCTEEGCCVAIDRCPPTFGRCRNVSGACDEDGGCIEENVPDGTLCNSLTGSTQCADADNDACDSVCEDGVCLSDLCPNDPAKTTPGICGCGVPDTDSDGDGFLDCLDGCPHDPAKTSPGPCGCGVSDADSDGDGARDCFDGCPLDPAKTSPGACGCGVPDRDANGNEVPDCLECPEGSIQLSNGTCGIHCAVSSDCDGTGCGPHTCGLTDDGLLVCISTDSAVGVCALTTDCPLGRACLDGECVSVCAPTPH